MNTKILLIKRKDFFYAKKSASNYQIHNLNSFKSQINNSIDFVANHYLYYLIFISLLSAKIFFTNLNYNKREHRLI